MEVSRLSNGSAPVDFVGRLDSVLILGGIFVVFGKPQRRSLSEAPEKDSPLTNIG
jgi:hypothetical protein